MYDFVCDHIIPGCTHKEHGEDKADVYEKAARHLREHHAFDHGDEPIATTLEKTGAIFIRPA